MNRATRVSASALGIYAALLGIQHGIFEVRQGQVEPPGTMINAMGPPCAADTVWHACYPAMTVVPNVLLTGILTIVIGLVAMVWAAAFVEHKNGGLILMLLSLAMLPVGGGFIPPFMGLVAGAAGTRIHTPLTWWPARLSGAWLRLLAGLWPWPLVILLAWLPGGWIVGHFFGPLLLAISLPLFFFFDLILPMLIVVTALARDVQGQINSQ